MGGSAVCGRCLEEDENLIHASKAKGVRGYG